MNRRRALALVGTGLTGGCLQLAGGGDGHAGRDADGDATGDADGVGDPDRQPDADRVTDADGVADPDGQSDADASVFQDSPASRYFLKPFEATGFIGDCLVAESGVVRRMSGSVTAAEDDGAATETEEFAVETSAVGDTLYLWKRSNGEAGMTRSPPAAGDVAGAWESGTEFNLRVGGVPLISGRGVGAGPRTTQSLLARLLS